MTSIAQINGNEQREIEGILKKITVKAPMIQPNIP